mgnify:CR=1 FL=1
MDSLDDAIADEKMKQTRRKKTPNEFEEDEEEDHEDMKYQDETNDSATMDDLLESMDSMVECFYSAQGRSVADILDFHLSRINQTLSKLQKQQIRIATQQWNE